MFAGYKEKTMNSKLENCFKCFWIVGIPCLVINMVEEYFVSTNSTQDFDIMTKLYLSLPLLFFFLCVFYVLSVCLLSMCGFDCKLRCEITSFVFSFISALEMPHFFFRQLAIFGIIDTPSFVNVTKSPHTL